MTLDRLFPAATSLLIVIFSLLLYRGLQSEDVAGSGEPIGTVFFKNRVAQRKVQGRADWQDLAQQSKVYNRDTIRTEELSEASVELNDGTKIEMDQNSMIVLAISEKAAQIRFAGGSVRAVGSEKAAGKSVEIRVGDKTIETAKGDVQLTSAKKGELVVNVRQGEAKLKVGDQEQQIKANQQSVVTGNQVQVRTIDIRPTEPPDNFRAYTAGRQTVRFSWSGVDGPGILEVSTDRSFSRLFTRQRGTGNANANLGPGLYYWRVRSADAKSTSPIRRVSVLGTEAVRLYAPLNGRRFEVRAATHFVPFSWSRSDFASAYVLEIADNAAFTGATTDQVSGTSFSKQLAPGTYFWRVRTVMPVREAETRSAPFRLAVVRTELRVRHVLLSPADTSARSRQSVRGNGLFFNWLAQEGVDQYTLEVASDSGFSKVVHRAAGRQAFNQFRGDLEAGTYYWRVIAATGATTSSSPTRRISITDSLGAPGNLTPAAGSTIDMSDRNSLDFSWSSVAGASQYRLELVRLSDGRRVVSDTTARNGYSLTKLETLSAGRFAVTVRAEGSGRVGDTARSQFNITIRPLQTPQIER